MDIISPFTLPSNALALILNGQKSDSIALRKLVAQHDIFIAVDGGISLCDRWGIDPDYIIGDLDSGRPLQKQKTIKHSVKKDFSDFQVALDYALEKYSPSRISIFAGTGNRLDHTISNLYTVMHSPIPCFIENHEECSFFLHKSAIIKAGKGIKISLMPLTRAYNVSTQGLEWEIKNQNLSDNFFSLSNYSLEKQISIEFDQGPLLVTLQRPL